MPSKRIKSKKVNKNQGKKQARINRYKEARKAKMAHASQVLDSKNDAIDDDLMKFEDRDLDDSIEGKILL